jgi:N-acetylneuraminic acid mutarotase
MHASPGTLPASPPRPAHRAAWIGLLFASLLASVTAEGAGVWQLHAPLRLARQETGAAIIGDSVYVLGGLLFDNPPLQATASVEIYRVSEGYWTFGDPMPVPLDHHAVAALGGRLFVIGGYSADFIPRADVWIYEPQAGWTPGPPLPSPRGAAWAVSHQGKIYVFGGTGPGGPATRSTFIYDPVANQWSPGADMPTAREHLNAVSAGSFIYVIGGRTGASTRVNERYNPATNQWNTMAPMPTARSAMAMAHLDGTIYAAGGEIPMLFALNEAYDITGNSWSAATPMAIPRHGVAAVALTDRIFAPGGGVVQGLAPTTAVDSYLPNAQSGIDDVALSAPAAVALEPNVPNPFAPRTTLHVVLPAAAPVQLTVYDAAGRLVRRLNGGPLPAGRHPIAWDARDDGGRRVPAGVYVVRLESGTQTATRKVTVTR